jgi:hypothetical protein
MASKPLLRRYMKEWRWKVPKARRPASHDAGVSRVQAMSLSAILFHAIWLDVRDR